MSIRVTEAMAAGSEQMTLDGAEAITGMENELELRTATLERLEQKITRLRASVEAGFRRLVDLKQGAMSARAVRREQSIQMRLGRAGAGTDAAN